MTRRSFLASSAAVLATPALVEGAEPLPIGLAKSPRSREPLARWSAPKGREVKVLQITDLHYFHQTRDLDLGTSDDLTRLVDRFQPDLIAATGDLWHDNPEGRGAEYCEHALSQITRLDRPWFFTWGNHDQMDDYAVGQAKFEDARGSLYRGGSSGGNYRIQILGADERVAWEFVCLNTTNQGMRTEQEDWLRELASTRLAPPPTLCFFHIPLLDYELPWKRGQAKGVWHEVVSHNGEDGSGFPAIKRLGRVRACFCGHDHVNDGGGTLEGIELIYGRATGRAGYGGDKLRKGAKLITLDPGSDAYRWETVFADGARWRPE